MSVDISGPAVSFVCSWTEDQVEASSGLFETLEMIPATLRCRIEVGCDGKKWPKYISVEGLLGRAKAKGANDLISVVGKLDEVVPTVGQRLADWIVANDNRGSLTQVNAANWIWKLSTTDYQSVVTSLWDTGIFPVSKWFVITGWDESLNIPKLSARRGALEFIVDGEEGMVFVA